MLLQMVLTDNDPASLTPPTSYDSATLVYGLFGVISLTHCELI